MRWSYVFLGLTHRFSQTVQCTQKRHDCFFPFVHQISILLFPDFHIWARFLSLARSKLRLCSANHRPGYWSNLPCDWPSTVWAYSEQETENGPWWCHCMLWDHRIQSFDVDNCDVIWEKRRNREVMAAFMVSGFLQHSLMLNTLRPRQDGWHFPDDIFEMYFLKWIYMNLYQDFTEVCC